MKVEELVKRLRGVDHMSVEDCFLQSPLFGHAADKLEKLAAENERLLAERDALAAAVAAQAPQESDEPLPAPGIHAAVHYAGWLRREAHRHQEPKASVLRQTARMLDVLQAECARLHQELQQDAELAAVRAENERLRDERDALTEAARAHIDKGRG